MRRSTFTPFGDPASTRRHHRIGSLHTPSRRRTTPARLILLATWLAALILCMPARMPAQCLVQDGSFEAVTTGLLPAPGWGPGPTPRGPDVPIPGAPSWFTRLNSPDIFWSPSHVPNNYMTDPFSFCRIFPFHGANYAGILTGRSPASWIFSTEVLSGTLSPATTPGMSYDVRARFAMGTYYNRPGAVRVSLGSLVSPALFRVGDMLVNSCTWMLFSKHITIPPGGVYDRIVIEGLDSLQGQTAFVFIDSVEVCRADDPCAYLGARLEKRPQSPQGSCCYDLIIDNTIPGSMTQPTAVRVTTQLPVQIAGPLAAPGWTLAPPPTPTQATWSSSSGPTLPTGTAMLAGHYCIVPNGVTPQMQIIEFLGPNYVTMCRDTIYTDCEAQTPPCLDLHSPTVICDTRDASGRQRYKISFWASPVPAPFPAGATLRIRSAQGTFSPSTFSVGGMGTVITTTFTDTPPEDSVVCIIGDLHIRIGERDSIACSDTICVTLPDCPEDCCVNFTKLIQNLKISYVNGNLTLSACAVSGPGQIKRFSATIVGAYTRMVEVGPLLTTTYFPSRVFGDITSGTLSSTLPGPTYVPGALFGREIVWGGSGSPICASFGSCVPFTLNMIFPDPPSAANKHDTLGITIRYSFTDCQCRTCDTTITYRGRRNYTKVIWRPDNPGDPAHEGDHGTTSTSHGPIGRAIPSLMRIDMSSDEEGTLSMTLPEADQGAPAIHIIGMSFRPLGVALSSMTRQGTQEAAEISGNVATPELALDGGESAVFDIGYLNSLGTPVIGNYVRFRYTIVGDEEQTEYETDDILIEAHIPGASGGDVVDEQSTPPVQGVRTYVLHVDADNAAGEAIDAIRVKVDGGSTKLIAVGPVGEGTDVVLTPGIDDDGNSVVQIDRSAWAAQPIAPATSLMPVYLTFAGAANGASIDYETINANGAVLTEGSVQLGSPLRTAGVGSDVEDDQSALWPLYPNPAGTAATVGFRLHQNGTVKLSVRDLQGREVLTRIAGEQMAAGDHLISVATGGLAQGTYIEVLDVDGRTFTRTLTVVR